MAIATVPHDGPIVTRAEAVKAGLRRYFTGMPCKKGHLAQRIVRNRECEVCSRKRIANYFKTELGRAAMRKYQATESYRDSCHKYRGTEKGRVSSRLGEARRRARKQLVGGAFTQEDYARLRSIQTKCHVCGRSFTKKNPATLDHVVPIALGGPHDASNITLAHAGCNSRKNNRRTHLI